jgi:hypothetical protein
VDAGKDIFPFPCRLSWVRFVIFKRPIANRPQAASLPHTRPAGLGSFRNDSAFLHRSALFSFISIDDEQRREAAA